MDTSRVLQSFMAEAGLSPEALGKGCEPRITGQSVRQVVLGRRVGAKVARALARRVPGLTVEALIDPPMKRRRRA